VLGARTHKSSGCASASKPDPNNIFKVEACTKGTSTGHNSTADGGLGTPSATRNPTCTDENIPRCGAGLRAKSALRDTLGRTTSSCSPSTTTRRPRPASSHSRKTRSHTSSPSGSPQGARSGNTAFTAPMREERPAASTTAVIALGGGNIP
jgi:hypothetical protein